jgi:manganese transport protein
MLVLSQIVLGLQLPFAIYPLLKISADVRVMGELGPAQGVLILAWLLFAILVSCNGFLLYQIVVG